MNTKRTLFTFAGMLAALALTGTAFAQVNPAVAKLKPKDFPTQPIEYTVVYPAGGALDITARLLAKYVEKDTGDKIIVNNRTGGAGMVGHTYLATGAKPDGYTVGVLVNLVWGDAMLRANGRWQYNDLEPIAYLNSDPLTWVASTDGAYKGKSAKEIIQIAKDKPGTVRVATVPGSMWEYLVEQIEAKTGAKFLRVPFQGGGAGVTALLGNNVDIAQGFFSEFRGYVEAGKIVPLALASEHRTDHLKNTPTFNELYGTNDIVWNIIRFAVVPKATPADRKAYLAAGLQVTMKDPELVAEYQKLGMYFDPDLVKSTHISADLDKLAQKEKEFYVKTGRLK